MERVDLIYSLVEEAEKRGAAELIWQPLPKATQTEPEIKLASIKAAMKVANGRPEWCGCLINY